MVLTCFKLSGLFLCTLLFAYETLVRSEGSRKDSRRLGTRIIESIFQDPQLHQSSIAVPYASSDTSTQNVTQGVFYLSSNLDGSIDCIDEGEAQFVTGYVTNTCYTSENDLKSFIYTCTDTSVTQYTFSDNDCTLKTSSKLVASSACVPLGDLNGNGQTEYGALTCYNITTPELIFNSTYIFQQFYIDNDCRNSSLIGFQGVFNNTCIDGVRYNYPNVTFFGDQACTERTASYKVNFEYCEADGAITDDAKPQQQNVEYHLTNILVIPTAEGIYVEDNDSGGGGSNGLSKMEIIYIAVGAGVGGLLLVGLIYYFCFYTAASSQSTSTPLLPAV